MKKSIFLMLAIVLTACLSPSGGAPQVTITPEATATLTPPPTETPIPTATLTPAISPEIKDAQEFYGEGFEIIADGKVIDKNTNLEIPGFTIIPFNEQTMIAPHGKEVTWGWQRVYEFEAKRDFTVVGTENDITVTENGGLDMYAWEYKNGEFTRQKVEFAAPNNGTVELEGFSPQEVQEMIINNSSDDPKYKTISFGSVRNLSTNVPTVIINREVYFTYNGMFEKQKIKYYMSNFIPIVDKNGNWSKIDTTAFVVKQCFKDRSKALVIWIDKNNQPRIVVMEGKYLDLPQYFNPYWAKHDIGDSFYP